MNTNVRFVVIILLLLALATPAVAGRLSLTSSVREVLDTNPQVLEKLKDYNASVAASERSRAGFFPVVETAAETGYQRVSNSNTFYNEEDDGVSAASVTLRQNIYNGGFTSNDVAAKTALARARLFDFCDKANSVAFNSVEAYINLLKYQRLYDLAVENVAIHKNILASVKERIHAGTGSTSELSRVQGRLAAAQSKLIMRNNDYKRAVYKFHQLIGRYVDAEDLVLPKFDAALLSANLKEAFATLSKHHPRLIAADFKVDSQRKQYLRDKSQYYPTLDLEASQRWSEDYNGTDGDDEDGRVLLKLRYRLYDGGARSALAQQNISLLNRQYQARNRIKRSLLTDLQLTWSGYKLLQSQIGALRKNMFFTREALNAYKAEFRLGKRNLINILDAENEYQSARAALAAVRFDLITAKYRVLYSTGTLVEGLQLTSPLIAELKQVEKLRPASEDTLELNVDFDSDKVVNNSDVSDNTPPGAAVNALGADPAKTGKYLEEPLDITDSGSSIAVRQKQDLDGSRFKTDVAINLDIVSFKPGSIELTNASKIIMRSIIKHVQPLAMEGVVQINVATSEFAQAEKNYALALRRGYNIMRIFARHNMNPQSMRVFASTASGKNKNTLSVKVATEMEAFNASFTVVKNGAIHFKSGTVQLADGSEEALARLAERLGGMGNPPFDIVVYSNDGGNSEADLKLSQQRARFLRDYLGKHGCGVDYAVPIAWGSYTPEIDLYADSVNSSDARNKVMFVVRVK